MGSDFSDLRQFQPAQLASKCCSWTGLIDDTEFNNEARNSNMDTPLINNDNQQSNIETTDGEGVDNENGTNDTDIINKSQNIHEISSKTPQPPPWPNGIPPPPPGPPPNQHRGQLRIIIHYALEMRKDSNFAIITIGNNSLRTSIVESNPQPAWRELFIFHDFRPDINKYGTISVGNKNKLKQSKIIGTGKFHLPTIFNQEEDKLINLFDSKNKLSGLIMIGQLVIKYKTLQTLPRNVNLYT